MLLLLRCPPAAIGFFNYSLIFRLATHSVRKASRIFFRLNNSCMSATTQPYAELKNLRACYSREVVFVLCLIALVILLA